MNSHDLLTISKNQFFAKTLFKNLYFCKRPRILIWSFNPFRKKLQNANRKNLFFVTSLQGPGAGLAVGNSINRLILDIGLLTTRQNMPKYETWQNYIYIVYIIYIYIYVYIYIYICCLVFFCFIACNVNFAESGVFFYAGHD